MLQWSLANLLAWTAQVTAIVAAGLLLPRLLRVRVPGARLVFLRVLLLACLLLPLMQPWATMPARSAAPVEIPPPEIMASAPTPQADGAAAQVAAPPPAQPNLFRTLPWQTMAIGVLAIGAVGRLGWLGLGLLSLARLRRSSAVMDPQPGAVEDAALVVGTRASFRVSPRVRRPVTFGLRQPVVLVPEGFLEFAPAEQSAIACHELLHVRRRDWLRTLTEEAVCAMLWFHPAIWWLVDEIHLSAEQVIDRHVVRLLGDRRSYLQALLRLAASGPEPMLQPAALFLKHGHLRQRVAMLIKETPMSRVRLAASFAVVLTVLAWGGWLVVQAFPLRAERVTGPQSIIGVPATSDVSLVARPPLQGLAASSLGAADSIAAAEAKPTVDQNGQVVRSGGQGTAPASAPQAGAPLDEATLVARIKAAPNDTTAYFVLSLFYEKSGRVLQAEEALMQAKRIAPNDPAVYLQLASFYNRQQVFEKTMEALKQRIAINPTNPEAHYVVANYYWDKAYRDTTLTDHQKADYVAQGMAAIDEALRLKPDYMEALTYKSLLVRLQANIEPDASRKQALAKEADALTQQARSMAAERNAKSGWGEIPPNAVRIGGEIRPPTKIKDVKPVYPEVAQNARVQGVVIVEAVITEAGNVAAVHVLRSIPLLDQAALDAVRQWEFTPTLLHGAPIPVVMTMTVNFTLGTPDSGGLVSAGSGAFIGGAAVGGGVVGGGGGGGGRGGVAGGVAGGVPGGISGGVAGGVVGGVVAFNTGVPPPPPPPPLPQGAVRVGGNIKPPTKVVDVKPVYPTDAKDARVQGVVIIEATIDTDGKVVDARILRSIPVLDQAALDAVKQWEFTPTIVDGVPVKVIMTVTVNFTMQ